MNAVRLAIAVFGIVFCAAGAFITDDGVIAVYFVFAAIAGVVQTIFELRHWHETPAERKARKLARNDWLPPEGGDRPGVLRQAVHAFSERVDDSQVYADEYGFWNR